MQRFSLRHKQKKMPLIHWRSDMTSHKRAKKNMEKNMIKLNTHMNSLSKCTTTERESIRIYVF